MKTIKISLAFLLALSTCFCAQAQNLHYGATLNLGVSTITSTKSFPTSEAFYRPSWNLGAYAEKVFSPQTAIGINLLWVQIQSKETTQNREIFEFNDKTQALEKVGVISDESKFHASYLGIPIYCRLSSEKFGVKFGLQALLGLFGGSSYKASGTYNGQPYSASSKTQLTGIRFFDWGPKVGFDYQISPKCRIGLEYYYGLVGNLSILKGGKKRQATLGVSYQFK
jgi:hypothetical protein